MILAALPLGPRSLLALHNHKLCITKSVKAVQSFYLMRLTALSSCFSHPLRNPMLNPLISDNVCHRPGFVPAGSGRSMHGMPLVATNAMRIREDTHLCRTAQVCCSAHSQSIFRAGCKHERRVGVRQHREQLSCASLQALHYKCSSLLVPTEHRPTCSGSCSTCSSPSRKPL